MIGPLRRGRGPRPRLLSFAVAIAAGAALWAWVPPSLEASPPGAFRRADAALVASMVHYGSHTIRQTTEHLTGAGIPVRDRW